MSKTIQTRVTEAGDVYLDFSGFTGHSCQTEEARLRRELAEMGLIVDAKFAPKSSPGASQGSDQWNGSPPTGPLSGAACQ